MIQFDSEALKCVILGEKKIEIIASSIRTHSVYCGSMLFIRLIRFI